MPILPESGVRVYTPENEYAVTTTGVALTDTWGRWTVSVDHTTSSSDVTVYANWVSYDGTSTPSLINSTTDSSTIWNGWSTSATDRTRAIMERWCYEPINARNANAIRVELESALNEQSNRNLPRAYEMESARLKEERIKATNLAEELLRSCLTEEQKKELSDRDWFLVMTKSGKIYRINRGRIGNVDLLDEQGKPIASYCIHNSGCTPSPDDMLLQKFLLDTDEEEFKRVANHRGAPCSMERANVVDISRFRKAA